MNGHPVRGTKALAFRRPRCREGRHNRETALRRLVPASPGGDERGIADVYKFCGVAWPKKRVVDNHSFRLLNAGLVGRQRPFHL